MAIDSAAKRKNVASLLQPFGPGVTPDATPDQFWRQAVGWGYGGILAAELVVFNPIYGLPVDWETTHALSSEWEFTHVVLVTWETTHTGDVEWEV